MVGCAVRSVDCREAMGYHCKTSGMALGPVIHTLLHMYPEASWFTVRSGVRGTSSRMQVGRPKRSSGSQRKYSRELFVTMVSITLLPVTWWRVS